MGGYYFKKFVTTATRVSPPTSATKSARSRHAALDWVSGAQGQEQSLDAIAASAGDGPPAPVVPAEPARTSY